MVPTLLKVSRVPGLQVVQQANPKGLHSAIETIQRYRHPSKLVSEAGYIFTHLVSAVHFLENVGVRCQPPLLVRSGVVTMQ